MTVWWCMVVAAVLVVEVMVVVVLVGVVLVAMAHMLEPDFDLLGWLTWFAVIDACAAVDCSRELMQQTLLSGRQFEQFLFDFL